MKLKKLFPFLFKSNKYAIKDYGELSKCETGNFKTLKRLECDTNNLMSVRDISLSEVFNSPETNTDWEEAKKEIDAFNIPDGTGGVNPGDRRALYYLLRKLDPASVLEIGTHIGASTIHIASALKKSQKANGVNLTTLDYRDVNSETEKPWVKYGTTDSPGQMIKKLNCTSFVNFVIDSSINYFQKADKKFDFIFLDGDHSASTVYNEVPAALKSLSQNGVILLHDYFPNDKPLWSNGVVAHGPYLATKRLIDEGADIVILPLGSLPWATKLGSNVTSLALVMRKN